MISPLSPSPTSQARLTISPHNLASQSPLTISPRNLAGELAAIDRELDAAGSELGGAAAVGPGVQPLTSSGLVALAAVRREAEEAMAAAEAEAEAGEAQ